MKWLQELKWRGLLFDSTDEEALSKVGPGTGAYIGFDPTAKSLQLGNLVPLIVAIHLGRAGIKPYVLFGGATGAIGDPSGKSEERNLMSQEQVDENVARQSEQTRSILGREGLSVDFLNNLDWFGEMKALDFLRDIGKHYSVSYMLGKEVVKSRVDSAGISFTEFSYMLLQGHDFSHLYKNTDIRIQFGGSDQWGNITAGLELIRRRAQGEAHAFCFPLITDSNGKKFGKSESGAIWLDPSETSPYKLHQYLLNVSDDEVAKLIKVFSLASREEIEAVIEEHNQEPQRRIGQSYLADSVCKLVHGEQAVSRAQKGAQVLFGGDLSELSETELLEVFADVPSADFPRNKVAEMTLSELFSETSLSGSKGEAKRLISSGGAYIMNERLEDPNQTASERMNAESNLLILRSGKKKYFLVRLQ